MPRDNDAAGAGVARRGTLRPLLIGLGLVFVAFQIWTAGFGQFPPLVQRSAHVGLGLAIGFLFVLSEADRIAPGRRAGWLRVAAGLGAAAVLVACGYIVSQESRITESFGVIATPTEMALATLLVVLVLVSAWRTTGPALPLLAAGMIAYTVLGDRIEGSWGHTGFPPIFLIEHLYLGTEGLWGTVTGLSANLISIFIIFGSFLLATGAARSFMDIALLVAGRRPGGAAKVATVASAMFGMLNGAAVANVATTGNFTIPAMRRLGYRPAFAGAVEATASSGGQLTPPIMGAGAFVMAELLGVPYLTIVYAAIIPAFLFFACIWFSVEIEARREDMKAFDAEDVPTLREALAPGRIGPLLATLGVTLGAMFSGNTPALAAFYGIVTNIALFLLIGPWTVDGLKAKLAALLEGATGAARNIVNILALLVCAQIVLSLIGLTGLGIKLSHSIVAVEAHGGLLFGTVLAMIVALILGMGMPTTAAYLLAAAVAAPALISLGVEPLVAHFFVFYSALLSALTPPVCTAVFTAAVIAGTHWWPICLSAIRLAAMKYVLPFFFIFREPVLLRGSWLEIGWTVVIGLAASMALAIGAGRFYTAPVPGAVAVVLVLSGIAVASGWLIADILLLVVLAGVIAVQRGVFSGGALARAAQRK
ncbi:TRAP transporter permease [Paralimibaculum aggregatum]|uniref:TRAP transporter permease n=1 Tax=Paralimibaculum aggregatum TaxID=3036245 RepID=A0ABQ6LR39_9RHOB|nr:TRAP transporter fused permease subunit [Limibaculum sp. NKW23]GMG84298.1 TRAP transporter permease [Limibaculum sp. NKW23]